MNKSLRDEVERLADDLKRQSAHATCGLTGTGLKLAEGQLRCILALHQPADGVVVPRELLENMAEDCVSYAASLCQCRLKSMVESRIEQADAILSEGKA